MPRDLVLDFRVGGGSVPEVAHGIVRIWGTEVRPNGPSVVVTTETTLKLSEGKATLANAQTSGTGPLYEWAYIIQVEPFCGRNYRFYVAIPDGTGPVNLVDLPKLNPITGEGFYLDIEEWEALYGDLPDRVDALETTQATQDGKITTLEARPSGNATMRVDTTVGTRVFITDGTTERMVFGDTGWRAVAPLSGVAPRLQIRRVNNKTVVWIIQWKGGSDDNIYNLPAGFGGPNTLEAIPAFRGLDPVPVRVRAGNGIAAEPHPTTGLSAYFEFYIDTPWPTTLPGTPA